MKVQSIGRNPGNFLGELVALAGAVSLLLMPLVAHSAGSAPALKSDAVKFEAIPDSKIKRVILSPKAAERLGIQTGKVAMQPISLRQVVGGRITPPPKVEPNPTPRLPGVGVATIGFAGFGQLANANASAPAPQPVVESAKSPAAGDAGVLITLSPGEWERLQKDKPARVMPLATRDALAKAVLARPSGRAPVEDLKRSMLQVFYTLPDKDHGLTLYHRVRVELPLAGNDSKQRVVPYSAVYYDAQGKTWVYVNPKPLVFERQQIVIERVVGDVAVISDGPAVDTDVVTTGAALLYGAEVVFKK